MIRRRSNQNQSLGHVDGVVSKYYQGLVWGESTCVGGEQLWWALNKW